MNSVRLVHILCSIWPYENGLIKQFKHKNQCHICNASPTYFGKFLFLWKTCFKLYLKWDMTFRSPHPLFAFSFSFGFFYEKKSDQTLSQHIKDSWKKNIYKSFFSKNLSLKIFFFAKKFLSWIIFLCKILFENSTSKKIIKVFTNDFFSKTFLHFFFFENSTLKIKNIHKRLFFLNSFPWKSFSLQNISFLELFFFAKDFFWKFRSFKNIYKIFFLNFFFFFTKYFFSWILFFAKDSF